MRQSSKATRTPPHPGKVPARTRCRDRIVEQQGNYEYQTSFQRRHAYHGRAVYPRPEHETSASRWRRSAPWLPWLAAPTSWCGPATRPFLLRSTPRHAGLSMVPMSAAPPHNLEDCAWPVATPPRYPRAPVLAHAGCLEDQCADAPRRQAMNMTASVFGGRVRLVLQRVVVGAAHPALQWAHRGPGRAGAHNAVTLRAHVAPSGRQFFTIN